jgi:hypothetical protein
LFPFGHFCRFLVIGLLLLELLIILLFFGFQALRGFQFLPCPSLLNRPRVCPCACAIVLVHYILYDYCILLSAALAALLLAAAAAAAAAAVAAAAAAAAAASGGYIPARVYRLILI